MTPADLIALARAALDRGHRDLAWIALADMHSRGEPLSPEELDEARGVVHDLRRAASPV